MPGILAKFPSVEGRRERSEWRGGRNSHSEKFIFRIRRN